jgi:endonuclease/exonuclease/phosphatase family metal-dependent hydrolase
MIKYLFFLSISTFSFGLDKNKSHEGVPYSWHYPSSCGELSSWSKIAAHKIASYLTDPPCKAREYIVRAQILQDLPPSSYTKNSVDSLCHYIQKLQLVDERFLDPSHIAPFVEKCFLYGGSALFATLSPFTALPGMALRFAASNLETEKFIHYTTHVPEKEMESKAFTHMQWNICGIKAGYDIEEGSQMPIQDDLLPFKENRIFKIAQKIIEEDADILCLNEVFDIKDATYLVDVLQNIYSHFIIHCGTRTLGVSSGLFFATKFKIHDINFTAFPKEILVDNAKYTEKGFLSLKTYDSKGAIATIIMSHLQNSDEPGFPQIEEEIARKKQLDMIFQEIDFNLDENVVVAGDLNLDDDEFIKIAPEFYSQFHKIVDYTLPSNEETKTWLGDKWYVEYGNRESTFSPLASNSTRVKRNVSSGINLDHVLVKKNFNNSQTPKITTALKSTGYDPEKISRNSLSDHMILFSKIELKR